MKLASFIITSLALSVAYYAKKYKQDDFQSTLQELEKDSGLPNRKIYDYIIVGAGTAGCVLAGRLSEYFNVLLLEAGGEPPPLANVPFFTPWVGSDPETNYNYESVKQINSSLHNGGFLSIPTGKMFGGSGSHNDLIFNRGNPRDYDNYAEILNDSSWKYENVLKYFKRAETFIGQLFNDTNGDYYGNDGPLIVDIDTPLILEKWFSAGAELGYGIGDPNGFQHEGFTPLAKLIDKGQRISTYTQYVKPYKDIRVNLTVIPYAVAQKILIDNSNQAYGVAYSRHGLPQIAHVRKEVIISAGTFVSPILLMKSGIGDSTVLNEAGIPVKVNSPRVGQNLHDHAYIFLQNFKFNDDEALPFFPRVPESEFEEAVNEYLNTGVGIFGELQEGPQALIVSSRAINDGEIGWPDSRITFDPSCSTVGVLNDDQGPSACLWLTLDRAKSIGSVTLNTTAYKLGETDTLKLAVIDHKMLEDYSDIEVLLENIKLGLRIMNTTAFRAIGAIHDDVPNPLCSEYEFKSDEYWTCFIQQYTNSAIHMVGTCAMGIAGTDAVTNSKFQVNGVSKLRVVDGSVLPKTPNANLNAPVVMLSEKAADDILSETLY